MGDGITRGYMAIYVEVDEHDNPMDIRSEKVQENYDGNDHDMIITGLNPGSRYRITVAGYTRRGDGVRSRPIYININRSGMVFLLLLFCFVFVVFLFVVFCVCVFCCFFLFCFFLFFLLQKINKKKQVMKC